MDVVQAVGWAIAALFAGLFVYAKVTGKSTEGLEDEVYKRQRIAREAVEAVQQLWESGQIPKAPDGSKHHLFIEAARFIDAYYPDLTEAQLQMTIESAVFWLKQGLSAVVADE
jgi:hypothetical protein